MSIETRRVLGLHSQGPNQLPKLSCCALTKQCMKRRPKVSDATLSLHPHVRREACARPQRRGVHLAHHEQHGFAAETSVGICIPRLQRGHGARAVNDFQRKTVRSVPGAAATPPPSMRLLDLQPNCIQVEARFLDGLPAHESDERGVDSSGCHPPGVEGNRHSAAGSGPASSYDPAGFGEDGKRRRAPEYFGGNGRLSTRRKRLCIDIRF